MEKRLTKLAGSREFSEFDRWAVDSFRRLVVRHAESDSSGGATELRDRVLHVLSQPDRQAMCGLSAKLKTSEQKYLYDLLHKALLGEYIAGPPGMDSLPAETALKELYDVVRPSEKHY